nr:TadE/TadG family type IV pilus assembly protein [Sphingomonas sp. Leaf412]
MLHDRKANTLVIMAMALIPLSGLAGSAVDMARLYVVKSRIQQACDAGVLAGRKFMATTSSSTLDTNAANRAREFFRNNMESGWLSTGTATFAPVKTTDNQVAGTASVVVPMTVMKIFAVGDATVNVACEARYEVADTDIVFVLDTTGSMACRPEDNSTQCGNYVNANSAVAYTRPSSDPDAVAGYPGSTGYAVPETSVGSGSRIKALRQAVKDFHATMIASVDANTRIRYSFVSYTSTVNAGRAIQAMSPSYMMGSASSETVPYQSRRVTADYFISNISRSSNGKSSASCNATYSRTPSTALTYDSSGRATRVVDVWDSSFGQCYTTNQRIGPRYTYRRYDTNVSQYLSGGAVPDPTKATGATSKWDGCIEERQTEAGTTSFTAASYDLDPDLVPTSAAPTRWAPMWADAEYTRWGYGWTGDDATDGDDDNYRYSLGDAARRSSGNYSCGKPIHRLSAMSASEVAAYVDAPDFKALGGTYHDTGMIWGARMLSSKGIFAGDNTGRAGQASPKKVIIFLTDGDMSPSPYLYGLYGMEYFDNRVSAGDHGNLKAYHNARFLAVCDRARAMGIDVWTVAIGMGSTPELKSCARVDTQALATTSGSGLSTAFQTIAKQVAMLRLQK